MSTVHPWQRRIFVDTEFTSIERPALISVALVAEDDGEFYAELADFDVGLCSPFVRATVLPQLGAYPSLVMDCISLRQSLRAWMLNFSGLKQRPVLCYDHPIDRDFVWELVGGHLTGWKNLLIAPRIDLQLREEYFANHGGRHHALHDARANRSACR